MIICTHNRAHSLEQTLKSLQEMVVPISLTWELIVVDNNSNDKTYEVVKNFIGTSNLNVKYVIERNQGLSHARNRGIHAAVGDIIAFTDDDCIVDRYWVVSISREFSRDPSVSGVGGRVELYDKIDKPVSIRTHKKKLILSSENNLFNLIIGCNMTFSRSVFDVIGMFDTDFGIGARYASSEDIDFLYRAYKKGVRIIYSPDVLIYHNHGRIHAGQINALHKRYAIGRGAFYCKYILMGDKDILHLAIAEVYSLIKEMIKRCFKCRSSAKQVLIFRSVMLGFICRLLRIKPQLTSE